MSVPRRDSSKELGLAAGLILGRHVLGIRNLHFGYWPDDLAVELRNLPLAQERFNDIILEHVPEGVETILEVGCGAGALARRLLDLGYRVEIVSPGSFLTDQARMLLRGEATVHECRFEDLVTDERYDLVLFSESYQYCKGEQILPRCLELIKPGGHLLICDYFNTMPDVESPIAGGRWLNLFLAAVEELPFETVHDLEITAQVARGFALLQELDAEVLGPIWRLVVEFLETRHPLLKRLAWWKFRRSIANFERGLARGDRSPENFAKFKSYRLFLLRSRVSDS